MVKYGKIREVLEENKRILKRFLNFTEKFLYFMDYIKEYYVLIQKQNICFFHFL